MAPLRDFFESRGIFTIDELCALDPTRSARAVEMVLRHHVKRGHIHRIQRGVYQTAHEDFYEPVLAASKLAPDTVFAYDTALHLLKKEPWLAMKRISVLTKARRRAFRYLNLGMPIFPIRPRAVLGSTWTWMLEEMTYAGRPIRITTLERTLVDVLDRIELSPHPDALWKWFAFNALDADAMIHWARKLKCTVTAARVGFLLELTPWATKAQLGRLPRLAHPQYFDRARRPYQSSYSRDWKLNVPFRLWKMAELTDFRRVPAELPPEDMLPQETPTGFQF